MTVFAWSLTPARVRLVSDSLLLDSQRRVAGYGGKVSVLPTGYGASAASWA